MKRTMQKKILILFFLIVFVCSLSACSKTQETSEIILPKSGRYRPVAADANGNEKIILTKPQYLELTFIRDGYAWDSFVLCLFQNMNMDAYGFFVGGSGNAVAEIRDGYLICKDLSDGVNYDIVYAFRILSETEVEYDESKSNPLQADLPKAYQLKDGARFRIPTEEETSHVFSRSPKD